MKDRLLRSLAAARAAAEDDAVLARVAPAVSAWSVGQQLEHVAKVNAACMMGIKRLARDPDAVPQGKPNVLGRLILLFGRIRRGRGSAPGFTIPADHPDGDGIRAALAKTEAAARDLPPLPARGGTTPHPALGAFTAKQWLRFAEIHADHHLRIVRDIVKAL